MKGLIKRCVSNLCFRYWSTVIICTENGTFPKSARSSPDVTYCKMWPSRSSLRAEVSADNFSRFVHPQSANRFWMKAHSVSYRPSSFPFVLFCATRMRSNPTNGISNSLQGVARACSFLHNKYLLPALHLCLFLNQFII